MDDEKLGFDDFLTVAVCAENSLNKLKVFFSQCDSQNVKQVGVYLSGVCGFICDNFMKGFEVIDSDGEFSKEVRVARGQQGSIYAANNHLNSIHISCSSLQNRLCKSILDTFV